MANSSLFSGFLIVVLTLNLSQMVLCNLGPCQPILATDNDVLKFGLNFQYLSAEFYLYGALGRGLDAINRTLASGGPPPIGPQIANLDPLTRRIIEEFGYQEVGELRAVINKVVGSFSRPLLNLSKEAFAAMAEQAIGSPLNPPFDPYANTINYLLATNAITYNGLVGLVQAASTVVLPGTRSLLTAFLGMEAGQNAVVRTLLYQRANETVVPYNITVAEFVNRTSTLSNQLGKCGIKDEGIIVPRSLGAENRTESNILAANAFSLSYARTPQELLRIEYGTGDERVAGGFFPNGANGTIARIFLRRG